MPISERKADNACRFFTDFLRHGKGQWAGQPFTLLPWQRDDVIRPLFGTLNEDGTRQYRECYVEVPCKTGKSHLAAGVALICLAADGERGAEVYGAAGDREQARLVYDIAADMVRQSPELNSRLKVISYRKRIVSHRLGAFYETIPADAPGAHGFNASAVILDEVHVQPNRDLYDVLTTSMGARRQPLMFGITTAGYDRLSLCWQLHEYAVKVRDGIIDDPRFLPVIYAADPEDDWTDPVTWHKANPSLGYTVPEEFYAAECKKALEMPAYENTFKRLYLNLWTEQATRFIPMEKWDACSEPPDIGEGRECYIGLDLSMTTDLTAAALLFPWEDGAGYDVLLEAWLPEDRMDERVRRDRVPYDVWARQGHVRLTPGNVVDYEYIRARLNELRETYYVREVGYDPWNATQLAVQLGGDGLEMVPVTQGFATMANPTKELLKLVLSKGLRHGGNPVLRWAASNMVVLQDPAGNVKPYKGKSTERIDPVVALVMALDRATRRENASVYAERGVFTI